MILAEITGIEVSLSELDEVLILERLNQMESAVRLDQSVPRVGHEYSVRSLVFEQDHRDT